MTEAFCVNIMFKYEAGTPKQGMSTTEVDGSIKHRAGEDVHPFEL